MKKYLIILLLILNYFVIQAQNAPISGSNYRERADAMINRIAAYTFNASSIDERIGFVYCAARYIKNNDLAYADAQINKLLDRCIQGGSLIYDEFSTFAVMHTYFLCKDRLSPTVKAKMKAYMQTVNFNSDGATYNLGLMPHSAAYLACEEWPDFVDASGRSHDEIKSFSKAKVHYYVNYAFLIHDHEVDAPTYYITNIAPFRMLANFTKDKELQKVAFSTYQMCIAFMNGCYNNGLYVANPDRSKGWANLNTGVKGPTASGITYSAWMFFGKATDQPSFHETNEGIGFASMNFWLAYPGYAQPLPSIIESNAGKTYPYYKKGIGFKRTYQSTNYGLATYNSPQGGPTSSHNWKEAKRTLLAWQSAVTPFASCHFTICQDNPRQPDETVIANAFGYGENPYHRVLQYNGTAIGIWNVPTTYNFYKVYNPFKKLTHHGILQKHGWIICHTGSIMFAIKTIEPYTWDTINSTYDIMRIDTRKGSWILETTELGPQYTGDYLAQMNSYADALHANTSITTIDYTSNTPRLRYSSLNGTVLDITYYDPNVAYTNQFKINEVVEQQTTAINDDICAYQDYFSDTIQIKSNGIVIDNLERKMQIAHKIVFQPDAQPNVLTLSLSLPSITHYWIVPEGTIFLNNTTPFSANPKIQLPPNLLKSEDIQIYVFTDDGRISDYVYGSTKQIATAGMIRYNSENYEYECFDGTSWQNVEKRAYALDRIITTPAAAFALRKLKASYTGNAIRVRRSSDNTLQDIGFLPNGELNEIALLNFVGNGSGFVHTWYNQSASNNATNTTNTTQPQIVANGVIIKRNGKPCVFSNGTKLLSATAPNPSIPVANCYISLVYEHIGNNTGGVLDLASASGLRFGVVIRNRLEFLNGGTFNPHRLLIGSNPVIKNTGLYVYGFRASASENQIAIRFNQNIYGTAGRPATSSVSNRIRLFIDSNSSYGSGYLSESIVFREALSEEEIRILERNQMLFYNSGIQ